jgi:outer membrane protein assembly factor BamB
VVPGPAVGKGDVVYAAGNGGVLHAIDPKNGHDLWTFDGGGSYGKDLSTTPALLTGGTVLWPGPGNTLFALSPGGHLLWKAQLAAQPLSPW